MGFELPEFLGGFSGITCCMIAGVATAIVVIARLSWGSNLDAFPTVGPGLFVSCWMFRFATDTKRLMQEGYEKYKPKPFKIAGWRRWIVILSGRDHLEELSRVSENVLSFQEAVEDITNKKFLLSPDLFGNPYHNSVIRHKLTRNLETVHPEIRDEIVTAFDQGLNLNGNEWKSVPAHGIVSRIIYRMMNRILVGLPFCRDREWIDLNMQCDAEIANASVMIAMFPKFLRALVACFYIGPTRSIKRCIKYLRPIIEERLRCMDEYGDKWIDKPNDMLSWLMDEAKGSELTVKSLVLRAIAVSSTATHTTTIGFTHALFYLAENPQYAQLLREEVEWIVKKDGWSTASLGKMRKVDSFLRECQRMEGVASASLMRVARRDFTFSDGTFIPKGTTMYAASGPIHHDRQFYDNPYVFEPLRFSKIQEEDGNSSRRQLSATSMDYLVFGHGKHACPGRFFAATVMKTMLAHVVMTHDVRLEDNTIRPPSMLMGTAIIPDLSAKVLFRKRID